MKFWTPVGGPQFPGIHLNPEKDSWPRVLEITILDDGDVGFGELCDEVFAFYLKPDDAIAALEEAISWIRQHQLSKQEG